MTQQYPFTRAVPEPGLPFGAIPSSAQMNTIDANAAQAADGLRWTDVAQCQLWNVVNRPLGGLCIGWDPFTRYFFSFNASGGNPVGIRSYDGQLWRTLTVTAGAGLTPNPKAYAANGAGVQIMGGAPGSSSNQKFRRCTDGITFGVVTSSRTNSAGVYSIAWVPQLSLFVAGHTDGSIETSPDGLAWTLRTTPNSELRSAMATNGSIIVAVTTASANTVTSTDAVTWTPRATTGLSASGQSDVVWSPYYGKFYACGGNAPGNVFSSSDGLTWSSSGIATLGNQPKYIAASGRLLIVTVQQGYYYCSVNGGTTWILLDELTPSVSDLTPHGLVASDTGQLLMVNGDHDHFTTMRGGFA